MKSAKSKRKVIKSIINKNLLAKNQVQNVKAIRKIMFYDKHIIQTIKQKQAITGTIDRIGMVLVREIRMMIGVIFELTVETGVDEVVETMSDNVVDVGIVN